MPLVSTVVEQAVSVRRRADSCFTAMGIVHHAAYLPYFEEARVAYLRHLDHPYTQVREEGIDFTVLEVYAKYHRPIRFDEVVNVHVMVGELTRVTCQIGYLLEIDGEVRATGVTVHGCVTPEGRPVRIPDWMRAVAHTTKNA